jgi:DNA-binding GntR family transcriptional regulator
MATRVAATPAKAKANAKAADDQVDVGSSKMEVAYDLLRGRIVDGTYGSGVRLVLDQIAREMNVSQLPVREAIRRLEAEGYVTYERNVGAQVSSINPDRYAETMSVLAIVEAAATGLAVPHIRRADLQAAKRINKQMQLCLDVLDPVRFTHLNQEFHRQLYVCCPNSYLVEMVDHEWQRMSAIRRSSFSFIPERARGAVEEHNELLTMIQNGKSAAQIEAFTRAHRMRTVTAFLKRTATS